MNIPEAKEILSRQVERLKGLPLEGFLRHDHKSHTEVLEVIGKYGRAYQVKIHSSWNHAHLHVNVSVHDGGLRSLFPLRENLVVHSKHLIRDYRIRIINRHTISYTAEHIEAEIAHAGTETNRDSLWHRIRRLSKKFKHKGNGTCLFTKSLKVKKEGRPIQITDKERQVIVNRIKIALINMDQKVWVDGKY